MQRVSSTRPSTTTTGWQHSTGTLASGTQTTATKTKETMTSAASFNIGKSTTAASRPAGKPSTQSSTFSSFLSSRKIFSSLSALAPVATPTTAISKASTNKAEPTNTQRFSFGNNSDNPFLERPSQQPSKDDGLSTSTLHETLQKTPKKSQVESSQQGLVLTRVLPINSPSRVSNMAATTNAQDSLNQHSSIPSSKASPKVDYEQFLSTSTVDQDQEQLELTFNARASTTKRAAPYKILSVNEREILRASRGPGFRARPIDPKVFTKAGESGVPRVIKQPLTVPISPQFSKRLRTKAAAATTSTAAKSDSSLRLGKVRTTAFKRLVNITKPPISDPHKTTLGPPLRGDGSNTATTTNAAMLTSRRKPITRPIPFTFATDKLHKDTRETANTTTVATSASDSSGILQREKDNETLVDTEASGQTAEKAISKGASGVLASRTRRPLTQPVPFKFATDDILRRRHVMFQPRGTAGSTSLTTSTAASVAKEKANPVSASVFKRSQPLKRLTVPIPFQLATQRRADVRPTVTQHTHTLESAAMASLRTPPRRSRLAGLFPVPMGHPIMTSSTHVSKPQFAPTVPISPKFGKRVPVPSLRPAQFVLKKSTKELTQPHEFHFQSDQRAKQREEYERQQSVKKREQELSQLQQKSNVLNQASAIIMTERDRRITLRESLERTYRARPVAHYQPTIIHKATRPLTKPVSPMIGEKRKRYEMEQQFLKQQQQEVEYQQNHREQEHHQEYSRSQSDEPYRTLSMSLPSMKDNAPDDEIYRTFEEAKILEAQQQALRQQLTEQERRQVALANSARATIHQPPIRLSFPMDPEIEDIQTNDTRIDDNNRRNEAGNEDSMQTEKPSSSSVASQSQTHSSPQVRDSFGGSNNHRLSRELRRISFEATRRTSSERGIRSRLSDAFSRRSASSSGSRKSGGESGPTHEYYPFTRSHEPTSVPSIIQVAKKSSVASPDTTAAISATSTITTASSAPSVVSTVPVTSALVYPTTPAVTSSPLPSSAIISTARTVAITQPPTTITSIPSSSAYIPANVPSQEKDENRRRSGSFIPLDIGSNLSPQKSSRLSKLFGAPPVSAAVRVYNDGKDSAATKSTLSRSKGPVVIQHTLTLSDL
ncbi:hypothetical protein FBU30_005799 [Linnemannia zychae]|nr:hypothetical protein FBU30_005799 [Linnemannia zychae]